MVNGFHSQPYEDIMIYTLANSKREAIDAWGAVFTALLHSLPDDIPFKVVMDVSSPLVGLSPYLHRQATELIELGKNHAGYLAFVTSPLARRLAPLLFARKRLAYCVKFFDSHDAAVAWINAAANTLVADNPTQPDRPRLLP